MNIISSCCQKSIVPGTRHESPLGDSYTIGYKTDLCESCGQECDPVESCDHCGEPFDGRIYKVPLGDYCVSCFNHMVDVEAERMRQARDWVEAI